MAAQEGGLCEAMGRIKKNGEYLFFCTGPPLGVLSLHSL